MTAPRPIQPGRTYLITRSCLEHRFLLKPDPETVRIFEYAYSEALARYDIGSFAAAAMSNHHHTVVIDRLGVVPQFCAHFHKTVAHLMNQHLGRTGQFWEDEQTSLVELLTVDDILDAVVYTLSNPVHEHLVARAQDWPGFTTARDMTSEARVVERPDAYFGVNSVMPASVARTLAIPAAFTGTAEEWFALVRLRLDARERAVEVERRAQGVECAGAEAVVRRSELDTPSRALPYHALKPTVKAASRNLRREALDALRLFRRLYAKALAAYRGGARGTIFPAGTFAMRVRYDVAVAPS